MINTRHYRLVLWLTVLCLQGVHTQVTGQTFCLDDSWTYHSHTHTCIKVFSEWRTWSDSKQNCGLSGNSQGHLLRIKDAETNNFIKNMLVDEESVWIGLTKPYVWGNAVPWHWDGLTQQVGIFTDWLPTKDDMYRFAYMTKYGWSSDSYLQQKYYICQYDAVEQLQLFCPASPVRENQVLSESLTCHIPFKEWSYIALQPVTSSLTYCSHNLYCNIDGYQATRGVGDSVNIRYTGPITRQHEGSWKCAIYRYIYQGQQQLIDIRTCPIYVYEPAASIQCSHVLDGDSLKIVCSTDKIYPKALCRWIYKSPSDNYFRKIPASTVPTTTSTVYQAGNNQYFTAVCSVTLKVSEEFEFKPGSMIVRVSMYPDVQGFDLVNSPEVTRQAELTVIIDPVSVSAFSANGEQKPNVTVELDSQVNLTCTAVGNPLPTVAMVTQNGQEFNDSVQVNGRLSTGFDAKCSNSGRYTCLAWNILDGKHQDDVMDVNIRVRCPPSPCEHNQDVQVEIQTGESASITICALAYPLPNVKDFVLQKATGDGNDRIMYTQHPYDLLQINANDDVMENVTLTFQKVQRSQIGSYRLMYQGLRENFNASFLYFRIEEVALGAQQDDSDNSTTFIAVGIPIAIVIISIIVVVIILLVKRRRLSTTKSYADEEEEEVHTFVCPVYGMYAPGQHSQKEITAVTEDNNNGDTCSIMSGNAQNHVYQNQALSIEDNTELRHGTSSSGDDSYSQNDTTEDKTCDYVYANANTACAESDNDDVKETIYASLSFDEKEGAQSDQRKSSVSSRTNGDDLIYVDLTFDSEGPNQRRSPAHGETIPHS